MNELKPCPFCGSTVISVKTIAERQLMDEGDDNYEWCSNHYDAVCSFLCGGCGASTGKNNATREEAIEAWNRRVGDTNE